MNNLWNQKEADKFNNSALALRAYSSRLLGKDKSLVLHGGGNTSLKTRQKNLFGEEEEIIFIKASGHDLDNIQEKGFSPCRQKYLERLAILENISDSEMAQQLKLSMIDPQAPSPSVEAILHAIIPFNFVDHTHADVMLAITNSKNGKTKVAEIFQGQRVLILPYVMPGFSLAKQIYHQTNKLDWQNYDGIILLQHGLFTFDDDAKKSYDKMISLVALAEEYLRTAGVFEQINQQDPETVDHLALAQIRKKISQRAATPMIVQLKNDKKSMGFAGLPNVKKLATVGPLTPNHIIHTQRIPMVLEEAFLQSIDDYCLEYDQYFRRNSNGRQQKLNSCPKVAIWPNRGILSIGSSIQQLRATSEIIDHTIRAIQWAEGMGGWQSLSEQHLFEMEYWELEQAKLKRKIERRPFEGKIIMITGAASGIGLACAQYFQQQGGAVIALDINPHITKMFDQDGILGLVCDITNSSSIKKALEKGIETFGGLDTVVINAGSFPPSLLIADLSDDQWNKTIDLNLSGHLKTMRESLPYLKEGIDPCMVIVASKNVPAPGPGAGAYSASKAGLTQLSRVAALELGSSGIRVNIIHPNAIFDTGIWTKEVLSKRAKNYGLTVEEYKRNNILKVEITSHDAALLIATLAGPSFAKITGAQIPLDGGNDRVI